MNKQQSHLVLGGARSGKSSFSEDLAKRIANEKNSGKYYVATATADDDEMTRRIERHKAQRDKHWHIIEEPIQLASVLTNAKADQCILIDCLTLWLSNCLHQECWDVEKVAFLNALKTCPADVIMVSNEVGSGIVPMGKLSRLFVDEAGWLHQALAKQCSDVSLIVAGLQSVLKTSDQI